MSSSPEQSTTPSNDRIVHNTSSCSLSSVVSEGAIGQDSPLGGHGHHPVGSSHRSTSLPISSMPNSPQIPSRRSAGKLQKGMKIIKRLRIPQTPNSAMNHPPTLHEDPLEQEVPNKEALFARMLRGSRKMRRFRRTKRRGIDKQYHSDDGYTSDPGVLREEEDDETDGDVDSGMETRRQQQMRNLERKIGKLRHALHEDDETHHGSEQDLEILPVIDDKPHKLGVLRFPISSLKTKSQRKKLENWETQLRLLQEGGPLESRYSGLREKIGGGLRGMSLGLRGRLTFKRSKRFSGSNAEVIDDEEDDETLDDISQTTEGVIHMETEEFANDEAELLPMLKLKENIEVIRQASEDTLLDNQSLRKELDQQKKLVDDLQTHINTIYNKLELEKERSERLEGQVNDITELHQHEVGELHTQIGQMESMSISKNQDLEDALEAYHSKLERLDVFVHRLIDSGDEPTSHIRKPVTTLISLVLMVFTLLLKFISFVRTKVGLTVTLVVLLLAVLVYWVVLR